MDKLLVMNLKTKGLPYNITQPIVGKVSRDLDASTNDLIYIVKKDIQFTNAENNAILISTQPLEHIDKPPKGVYNIVSLDHLQDGDIVVINTDGIINTLYRVNSRHNFLVFTERCNSNCLMCSQPPKDRNDIPYLFSLYKKLIPLIPKNCPELCLTGGEPTLLGERFFELLSLLNKELPDTDLHCLTNGRVFAWKSFTARLETLNMEKIMFGIPLYSDFYQVHDYIVQAKEAFNQTISGLYHLAEAGQRIELRIVLHKQSIPRLTRLARYIYKNLPFVEQVVFMGLEHQGYTPFNIEKLWIDPHEYIDALSEAVLFLAENGFNVSIYNFQLCLLPNKLWKFTKKSISDWKNIYLDVCKNCSQKENCGGLFASAIHKHSDFLKAI